MTSKYFILTSILFSFILNGIACSSSFPHHSIENQQPVSSDDSNTDPIPFSTRAYWMRRANTALGEISPSPCPFEAFGSVVVNHTDASSLGNLICIGVNSRSLRGNPTLHGEIATINNCTNVLQGPDFKLSSAETLLAFRSLSLYTNAEACPMCASAIRWAGFREYIYGTSLDTLIKKGWSQFRISSLEIFEKSNHLPSTSKFIGSVLANETDVYFSWQYDPTSSCPPGCQKKESGPCIAL